MIYFVIIAFIIVILTAYIKMTSIKSHYAGLLDVRENNIKEYKKELEAAAITQSAYDKLQIKFDECQTKTWNLEVKLRDSENESFENLTKIQNLQTQLGYEVTALPEILNILVIEDGADHGKAAKEFLSQHNVTLARSADEAFDLFDQESFPFHVVLTDLLLPASNREQGSNEFTGRLTPYGYSFALLAVNKGVRYVAISTDLNHHQHPLSAAMDRPFPIDHFWNIDGSRMLIEREGTRLHSFAPHEACPKCRNGEVTRGSHSHQCYDCDGSGKLSVKVKSWDKLLTRLIA